MNCKPGDLVIVVKGYYFPEYEGHIFRVIKAHERWSDCWISDKTYMDGSGRELVWADSGLRPIRDNPGEDEMLRIVGKPKELTNQGV